MRPDVEAGWCNERGERRGRPAESDSAQSPNRLDCVGRATGHGPGFREIEKSPDDVFRDSRK